MWTGPVIMLRPMQVQIIVRFAGLILVVSAIELLAVASGFHIYLKDTRKISRNYTYVLQRFYDFTHPDLRAGPRHVKFHAWHDLVPAVCHRHFLDQWFLLLAFVTVFLSIYQLSVAVWGTAVTWVDREKPIMLSLWISRVWEPCLHLLGINILLIKGSSFYRQEQSDWITMILTAISRENVHDSQRYCQHAWRDSFYASLIFNAVILAVLNAAILLLGLFTNQRVSVEDDRDQRIANYEAANNWFGRNIKKEQEDKEAFELGSTLPLRSDKDSDQEGETGLYRMRIPSN